MASMENEGYLIGCLETVSKDSWHGNVFGELP